MLDFGVARDKLIHLETGDEIADFLQSQGVTATPGDATNCAIAVWMQRQTGQQVRVSQQQMWVLPEDSNDVDWWFTEQPQYHEHTPAMQEFTVQFDDGQYPDLIEPGWMPECTCCGKFSDNV